MKALPPQVRSLGKTHLTPAGGSNGTRRRVYSCCAISTGQFPKVLVFFGEGDAGTGARLASAFRGWPRILFEAVEDPSPGYEGERFASTPALGLFRATTGVNGDILVGEDRLRAAVARAVAEDRDVVEEIERLLGQPWDEELEPFRWASDGAPIRVLHQVV